MGTSRFWISLCGLLLLLWAPAAVQGQSLQYVPVISSYVADPGVCSTATDTSGNGCVLTQLGASANAGGDVFDNAGNLYFTDTRNKTVRRVDGVTGIVTLVAGGGPACAAKTNTVGDGCPATQATFTNPVVLAFDPNGNLVIGDSTGYRVRRIDKTTGIITTIAGTGVLATTIPTNVNPALATATPLAQVNGLAFDRSGNLYIGNYAVAFLAVVAATNGVINPATSVMYNVAGDGTIGTSGDGGPPTSAEIGYVRGVAIDPAGNLYLGDWLSYKSRKITPVFQNGVFTPSSSTITTIAGNGTADGTPYGQGNGGAATAAKIHEMVGIALDSTGLLYLNQYKGDVIRTVNLNTGIINAFAGTGTSTASTFNTPALTSGLIAEQFINLNSYHDLFTGETSGTTTIARISLNGDFLLNQPVAGSGVSQTIIAQATAATTLQAAALSLSSSTEFSIGTLSGCSIGAALAASAYCTLPITFNPALPGLRTARLSVQDGASLTTSIGLSGIGSAPNIAYSLSTISTITGNGAAGNAKGQVSGPRGGAVDGAGNLYFADTGNNIIRMVSVSGAVTTVAGTGTAGYTGDGFAATAATLKSPAKVAVDAAGNLYIADSGNNVIRFVNVDTGLISTIAGTGTAGYTGDTGAATSATLSNPQGLAVDRGGNVYVADTGNSAIRLFTPSSWIVTIAGTGTAGNKGDGGPASQAALSSPQAVALDNVGRVFIADTGNAVIRQISAINQISTVVGTAGGTANSGDGALATAASLLTPSDVAVDAGGNIYISAGGQVRQVSAATQIISTIAGNGGTGSYSGDGGLATSAVIPSPASNLILDASANIYIADTAGNRLLEVSAAALPALNFGIQAPGTTGPTTTFSIMNTGNLALNLSGLAATAGFTLQAGSTSACTATTVLSPGQSCSIGIAFTPAGNATGAVTGTLTFTDNALNGSGATQVITLSGSTKVVNNTTVAITTSPTSPVYGSPVTITATVNNGNSPTGNVSFTVNGSAAGSGALNSNNQYSITLPSLPAGTTKIVATYAGDSNNNSSTGTANVTVRPAVLTVTAANATVQQTQALPSFTYTITGFINGDTSSVVSGSPSEITTATTSSPQGTYPITISLGTLSAANYTFVFVNGTLTVGPPPPADFTLSVTPTTTTVNAGSASTLATLTLTPIYGYTGTVQISCTSSPGGVGCASTGPLTGSGTSGTASYTQIKLFGTGTNTASTTHAPMQSQALWFAVGMPVCLFGLAIGRRGKRGWPGKLLSLVVLVMAAAGVTSCSGSQSTSRGIAAGTYQITITAADSTANLSHTTTLTLISQ